MELDAVFLFEACIYQFLNLALKAFRTNKSPSFLVHIMRESIISLLITSGGTAQCRVTGTIIARGCFCAIFLARWTHWWQYFCTPQTCATVSSSRDCISDPNQTTPHTLLEGGSQDLHGCWVQLKGVHHRQKWFRAGELICNFDEILYWWKVAAARWERWSIFLACAAVSLWWDQYTCSYWLILALNDAKWVRYYASGL